MKRYLIGEVAKLHNISVEALRYYDKEDLFKPAYIDIENGYRYYFAEQFIELTTIIELKTLGFPLKDIKNYIDNKDIDMTFKVLKEQNNIIQIKINELSSIKEEIQTKLKTIKTMNEVSDEIGRIIEKNIPRRNIFSLSGEFKENSNYDIEYIDFSKKEYERFTEFKKEVFLGYNSGVTISKENLQIKNHTTFNKFFLLTKNVIGNDHLLEGRYITHLHKGSYDFLGEIYDKLLKYIDEHGYTILDGSIEIGYIDSVITKNQSEFLTEIQILIK